MSHTIDHGTVPSNSGIGEDGPQVTAGQERMMDPRFLEFFKTIKDVLDFCSDRLEFYPHSSQLEELSQYVKNITTQNASQISSADRNPTAKDSAEIPATDQELIMREIQAWKQVLGVEVDIKPLPTSITPEVRRKLERMGMELRFIPGLNLGTLDDLRRQGPMEFLIGLQNKYPNWRRLEALSDSERQDPSVTRNLEEWLWELALNGQMDFPTLPGNWVAVETMPKFSIAEQYSPSLLPEMQPFDDRFSVSWHDANVAMNRYKDFILFQAGLSSGDVRMLTAVECNLLANREGWVLTNTYEWNHTEGRENSFSGRIVVNRSNTLLLHPERKENDISFRVVVVLDPL